MSQRTGRPVCAGRPSRPAPAAVPDAPAPAPPARPGDRPGSWFTASTSAVLPPLVSVMTAATQHMSWSSALSLPHPYHESIVHLLYNNSSHYIHAVSFFLLTMTRDAGLRWRFLLPFFPEAAPPRTPPRCLLRVAGRGAGCGGASPGTRLLPLLSCRVCLPGRRRLCCVVFLPSFSVFIGKAKVGLYYLKSVSSPVLLLL